MVYTVITAVTPSIDKPKASRLSLVLAFASLYVLWGSTYLAIHYLLAGGFTPFLGAGLRMLVAGLILLSYLRMRGVPLLSGRDTIEAAVAGGFLFVGGNGLVMVAQQWLPSGLAATLIATTPFWMAGLERLLPGGERISGPTIIGIAVGFLGVALLVWPRLSVTGSSVAGVVALLVAPSLWSVGALWAKHRLAHRAPLSVTAYEMLLSAPMLAFTGLVRGELADLAPQPSGWLALAYLIVFGSLMGFSAFVYLMANVPAAQVATYSYVNPAIAVLLGWLLADERLSGQTLAATAIIILGVALVTLAPRLRWRA